MKHFAAWVIALSGLFGVAIAAILFSARTSPAPNDVQALGFGQCAGLTCFWGVTPGITAWEAARTILGNRLSAEPDDQKMLAVFVERSNAIVLYPSIERGKVGRIIYSYFPYARSPLTTGALIEQYGLPCGVSIYYEQGIVTLRYPALLANISTRGQSRLTFESPIYQVQLSDPAFHSKAQPDPCLDNITGSGVANTRWMGFTSIRNYISASRR